MADLDARLVARSDQVHAQVADLVRQVRAHHPACETRLLGTCVGVGVWEQIRRLDRFEALQLLGVALGQLSTQPAPTVSLSKETPSWE